MSLNRPQWKKLRDKKYREEFVAAQAKRAIPFQIRALMHKKKISQQELADRAGLTQGVVSRAANPAYGNLALNTIIRVAAGLDVAFIGTFVPFSKLVDFYDKLSEEHLADVPTFPEEDAEISASGREPDAVAAEWKSNVLEWNRHLCSLSGAENAAATATDIGLQQLPFGPKLAWPIRKGTDAVTPKEPADFGVDVSQRNSPEGMPLPSSLEGQLAPESEQMAACL